MVTIDEIRVGQRVKVFDSRLFVNDIKTPLSLTMQPAKIVAIYEYNKYKQGEILISVIFERDNSFSEAHYLDAVDLI